MSSHRKCPLVGVSLPLHFSTLRQEKASGGKSPVVGTKLWWCLPHLFSNASLSSKLSSPKTSHSSLPTTPVPQVFSFRPLLLHKGLLHTILFPPLLFHKFFLSDHSCFIRVCFTQFSSHHSCSTSFFFPTTPASQGLASHNSLPTTPVPQVFSFRPLLLHKGLLHTFLSPPLLLHKGFASPPLLPHKGLLSHHSCSTKVCLPTTPAPQGFVSHSSPPALFRKALPQDFPPLLLHRNLFHKVFPALWLHKA